MLKKLLYLELLLLCVASQRGTKNRLEDKCTESIQQSRHALTAMALLGENAAFQLIIKGN